ncbi:MAG: PD40 domain-containing protein, partial [Pseudomonadota bacterium]
MRALDKNKVLSLVGVVTLGLLGGCSSGSDSGSVAVQGDVAIAYVKRPVATLGNPTDAITFAPGGDLYMRERSSPSAPETCITCAETQGAGDVSDPEVSYDGTKILFTMRKSGDPGWRVREYDLTTRQIRTIACDAAAPGDDVDPAYLPDGRIVFASNRQEKSRQQMATAGETPFAYLDEYERERVTALHVMNNDGSNCRQISFNQSHDRNPTVLRTGEVMYSRWDHVGGRNQFSIFFTNPDGTNLFVLYGAHSPGNSFLHPREMPDGRVISSLMPLSRTNEGGALMAIDVRNYSENCEPADNSLPACGGQTQTTQQLINFGMGISEFGRFSTPYPLWDGTNRALVTWTPSCAAVNIANCPTEINPLTGLPEPEESTPVYGVYMLDLTTKAMRPVVTAPAGYAVLDAV